MDNESKGFRAIIPLLVFVGIFLGAGIGYHDFYKLPSPVAALCGVVVAFVIFPNPLKAKVETFIKGCGQSTIITMCIIYLLAGAFAAMAKAIGSVDAIVYYGAHYLSLNYLYAGMFLITVFLSFAAGTSVGAIATLAPAVVGFTAIPSIHISLLAAALLSGAMFGDNLSFISDTTIAATQTQGCSMKDKFRVNSKIAFPAAVLTAGILIYLGFHYHDTNPDLISFVEEPASLLLVIPYFVVIVLALTGLNVFAVLFCGIIVAVPFALWERSMSLLEVSQTIYDGFLGMNEIFLLSMLTGGLAYMVEKEGGISYIFNVADRFINSEFKAKTGISWLTGIINIAVANNTVAIIISAPIAKKISANYSILPKHTASIMDISSCIVQGIIPYGAQVLLLLQLIGGHSIDYLDLISQAYYLWILAIFAIIYFKFVSGKKAAVKS